ncbi:hypothetical protein BAU01nite_08920 [Brevibacterium aurantiacum]|nr:hypothetical protein BAU01nite_08920 [Brevibacterium aurantiacum]
MAMNCVTTPRAAIHGFLAMRAKSGKVRVSPMKNMTTPRLHVIVGASGVNVSGVRNPRTPAMTTRTGSAVTAMIELRSAFGCWAGDGDVCPECE